MLGCIPCTPEQVAEDERLRPYRPMVGAAPRLTERVDLRSHLDFVPDQGQTSSCVANAVSSACFLAGQAQSKPLDRPSRRWLYDLARYYRTPGILKDEGSSAYAMCSAAVEHGLVSEERYRFDPAAINEPPPFDLDVAGQDALMLGWARAGDDPEQLAVALAQNEVPCIAIPVHTNFRDWATDSVYTNAAGDFLGYHMLTVVGFEQHPIFGLVFLILNSWGTRWADGGFIRMTGDFIQRKAFDRMIVRSAPAPR